MLVTVLVTGDGLGSQRKVVRGSLLVMVFDRMLVTVLAIFHRAERRRREAQRQKCTHDKCTLPTIHQGPAGPGPSLINILELWIRIFSLKVGNMVEVYIWICDFGKLEIKQSGFKIFRGLAPLSRGGVGNAISWLNPKFNLSETAAAQFPTFKEQLKKGIS